MTMTEDVGVRHHYVESQSKFDAMVAAERLQVGHFYIVRGAGGDDTTEPPLVNGTMYLWNGTELIKFGGCTWIIDGDENEEEEEDMSNYYTKSEIDEKLAPLMSSINLAADTVVIPKGLPGYQQTIEAVLNLPVVGVIQNVHLAPGSPTHEDERYGEVSMAFSVGSNQGAIRCQHATDVTPILNLNGTAKVGQPGIINRNWNRTDEGTQIRYTLNLANSFCICCTPQANYFFGDNRKDFPQYIKGIPQTMREHYPPTP